MDSDDIDSELEMQNETNEEILFGFAVEDDVDGDAEGVVQLDAIQSDTDGSDSDLQLEDMQSDEGDTDR